MRRLSKPIKIAIFVLILILLGVGTVTYSDQYSELEKQANYLLWDRENIPARIRDAEPAYIPDNIDINHTGMPYYYDDKETEDRQIIGKRVQGGEEVAEDRPVSPGWKRLFYYVIDASYAHLEPEVWEYRVLGRDGDRAIEDKQEFTFTIDDVTYHVVEGITRGTIPDTIPNTEDDEKYEKVHYGVKWEADELKYSFYTINIDFEELKKIIASF